MKKKKKKFPNIVYNDTFNNAVSAATISMEDFGNMYYKIPDSYSLGDKPLVKCTCGKIIEKDKALDGKYCNTTCKYDLENIEEENSDEEGD